jgi:glycosyltransferase involved in cell wall biosynthesis
MLACRVGLYNRWLATLGGGEQYSLALAELLARDHDVSVISHTLISKDEAERRLRIDLSRVKFVTIPMASASALTARTREYDLFINASQGDFIASEAPCSVLVVYFPVPLENRRWRTRFASALQFAALIPEWQGGVYDLQELNGQRARYAGAHVVLRLPASRREYNVRLTLAAGMPQASSVTILLNGLIQRTIELPAAHEWVQTFIPVPPGMENNRLTVETASPLSGSPPLRLTDVQLDDLRFRLYQLLFERLWPQWGMRLRHLPVDAAIQRNALNTYHAIWPISQFSQTWVKKYWGFEGHVISPPVRIAGIAPMPKRRQILSVGRFFAGSHNKKHLVMICVFKRLMDDGLAGWELHLAGGTTSGPAHQAYLRDVLIAARGYPIFIHSDCDAGVLLQLYGESAIYWHASGYGENEQRHPIRFEHFGITTVEAMAAGCVPVVLGAGGQREIVKHGHNGFVWHERHELKHLTRQLVDDLELRTRMSEAARADSCAYEPSFFEARVRNALEEIWLS